MLPVVQPAVVERVEHELAREPEEVERPRPVFGDERAGRGEVLAAHDLFGLGRPVLVRRVLGAQAIEGRLEVAQLLLRVTGLAQLVAAGERERGDLVPEARVRVVPQPARGLHDVRVGVVHHSTAHVRHCALPLIASTPVSLTCPTPVT